AADAAEELHRLRADERKVDLHALLPPFGHVGDDAPEQVDVQRAGQAAVGRDDDVADALHLALDQPRMPVIRVGVREVTDHPPDPLGVGARSLHLRLSLADLARGDHFHRLGDLLHAPDAADLVADFLFAGHGRLPQYAP